MGVRAWVAAGLVAAGMWTAPAFCATLFVTLKDDAGRQAIFTPTFVRPDLAPLDLLNSARIATPTSTFYLNSSSFYYNSNYFGTVIYDPFDLATYNETFGTINAWADFNYNSVPLGTFVRVDSAYAELFSNLHYHGVFSVGSDGTKYYNDAYILSTDTFVPTLIAINAVPEISTWALMLAGFAGLGAYRLRRVSTS